jgi:hypothetical protein
VQFFFCAIESVASQFLSFLSLLYSSTIVNECPIKSFPRTRLPGLFLQKWLQEQILPAKSIDHVERQAGTGS